MFLHCIYPFHKYTYSYKDTIYRHIATYYSVSHITVVYVHALETCHDRINTENNIFTKIIVIVLSIQAYIHAAINHVFMWHSVVMTHLLPCCCWSWNAFLMMSCTDASLGKFCVWWSRRCMASDISTAACHASSCPVLYLWNTGNSFPSVNAGKPLYFCTMQKHRKNSWTWDKTYDVFDHFQVIVPR